jgi:hypothetical protein
MTGQQTPPTTANEEWLLDYHPQPVVANRRVPAWLMSVILHALVFVGLLLLLRTVQRGGSDVENRTGGIVLVDIESETTEYLDEGDIVEASNPATDAQSPPPQAAFDQLPPDLPGLDSSPAPITGVGDQLVDLLPGADSLIDVPTANREFGGKVTTEVFGVKGTGSRFVYVFDRSKSMEGYEARPLMAARQALLKSLQSLGSNHQFQIIFYNDDVKIFKSDSLTTMHFATDEIKSEAVEFVEAIRGDRGTDHLRALKQAFRLGPDVIFLLTDAEGGFTSAELREVADANRSGAVINAIEFGDRQGGDRSLQSLANQNGGQYLFKNVRTLKID